MIKEEGAVLGSTSSWCFLVSCKQVLTSVCFERGGQYEVQRLSDAVGEGKGR